MDELIGLNGVTESNVHEALLAVSGKNVWKGSPMLGFSEPPQVFTLHAELEGLRFLPALEALILSWKSQGYELVPTQTIAQTMVRSQLPYFNAVRGELPGRSGTLLMQGAPFLPIAAAA
jgi:hypothetical protein